MEGPPTGNLNIPILCQYLVQKPLEIICVQFSQSIIHYYMNDILLVGSKVDTLEKNIKKIKSCLAGH